MGALRRSDGKVFRVASVPSVVAPNYYICGNDRPIHEIGRAFDGPQDVRNDGVNSYTVGVEWEYYHGAFGIAQITAFNTAHSVAAVVVERLADSIVGTSPAPVAGPWTLSGDGVDMTFAVAGATSLTQSDYVVTIAGVPVSPDPYQEPTTGGGGGGGGSNAGPRNGDPPTYVP